MYALGPFAAQRSQLLIVIIIWCIPRYLQMNAKLLNGHHSVLQLVNDSIVIQLVYMLGQ